MNQSAPTDSDLSLDLSARAVQNPAMTEDAAICLTRIDPACNMARFYRLEILSDLFGGVTLVRNWGRIGGTGREQREWFAAPDQAESARRAWIDRKIRRGYAATG